MKLNIAACVAVWVMTGANAAAAAAPSLYGVTLGQRLELPECQVRPGYENRKPMGYMPTFSSTPSCTKVISDTAVDAHIEGLNTIAKDNNMTVYLRDGLVDRIELWTNGVEDQDDVLQKLTTKFGKPRKLSRPRAQNRMGAAFGLVDSEWRIGSARLRFSTNTGSLDSGYVELISGEAARELREQANKAPRDPRL